MLTLRCRQRLRLDAETLPIEALADTRVRAAAWEFAVVWSGGDPARVLTVNEAVLRRDQSASPDISGKWWFSLPPTVRDLTHIAAESFGGERVVAMVKVAPNYQLPETRIGAFIDWFQLFRTVWTTSQTEGFISVVSLLEGMATLRTDTPSEIQKLDLPSEYVSELSSLFDRVIKSPLSRLVDEMCLVDPGEVQRITPATADFFIRHPETWYRKAYVRPRPIKLLDERSADEFDVYENRFVLHFLEQLDLRLQSIVGQYENTEEELRVRLPESEYLSNVGLLITPVDMEDLRQQELEVREILHELKRFRDSLFRLQAAPMFARVRRLTGFPRPNTVLRMHPVYGRLYRLYEELGQAQFSHQHITVMEEARSSDFQGLYADFCLVTALTAITGSRFEPLLGEEAVLPVERGEGDLPSIRGSADQGLKLEFRHSSHPEATLTLEYCLPSWRPALQRAIRLEFHLKKREKHGSTTEVWLIPDTTWWGDTTGSANDKCVELHDIYDRLEEFHQAICPQEGAKQKRKRHRHLEPDSLEVHIPGTMVLLHPTPPARYDNRLGYQHLRLLLTQGDNFATGADFERFGGYKVGALPLYPGYVDREGGSSADRSILRIKRLIRIHLFRIGVDSICWRCFQTGVMTSSGERGKRFTCKKCRLEWGAVICNKCGTPIVKAILRRGSQRELQSIGDLALTASESMLISEAVEGRLAVSSVCEAFDQLDGHWAICPNCGNCEKEGASRSCCRCQTRAALEPKRR